MMNIREISLYSVFGGITTLISILSYKLFLVLGLHYLIATTLSATLAVLFAYITNRIYVFRSNGNILAESIRFLTGRIGVFIIETILLIILVSWVKFDEFYSKIIVTIIVVLLNYIYSKFFVFTEGGRSEE